MTENISSKEQALIAARAIDDKKGSDIVIQEVGKLLNVTDYFVICTAANNRRADSIYEEVEERLRKEAGVKPISVEGVEDGKWILLDYGQIVGIEDPVYSERIAALIGRNAQAESDGEEA